MRYFDPYQDLNRFLKAYYVYSLETASIAAAANDTDTVNINSDSRFIWTKAAFFCDIAGAVQTDSSRVLPLVDIQLTDTGSGRQFFDDDLPIPSLFGSGSLPFILPYPYEISPNATLNATFTNFSAATTYVNLKLILIGYRVYEIQRAAPPSREMY